MSAVILKVIGVIIYSVMGGYFICFAIDKFKKDSYFVAGINVMLALYEILGLVKLVFV